MTDGLFRNESLTEYFKEQVEAAVRRQRLETSDQAAFYVVNLLCAFVHPDHETGDTAFGDEPLALQLGQALGRGGVRQREGLRRVGDCSLFISGFFSDSLRRKLVDVDYYIALGGCAYGSLSQFGNLALSTIFGELADKFVAFVDVLAEVSETSGMSSDADLLRLYEKWLRTGSRRDGQRLVERGLVPNASIGSRFFQEGDT